MKKYFFLSLLILPTVFVLNIPSVSSYEPQDAYTITYEVGWNLMTDFPDLLRDRVSSIYYLNPQTGKYFGGTYEDLKNPNTALEAEFNSLYAMYRTPGSDNGMELSVSGWAYVTEKTTITEPREEFESTKVRFTPKSVTEAREVPYTLFKGWNLVSVHPFLMFETLQTIEGDCNIEKSFSYNSAKQSWEVFLIKTEIQPSLLFKGLAVKVTDGCRFDLSQLVETSAPPALP